MAPPAFARHLLASVLIVVAAAAVFANALGNEFHLDDWYRIANNPAIEQVSPMGRHFTDPATSSVLPRLVQYRPLLPLTLSWNYALNQQFTGKGHDLTGYHLGNLAIHVLSCLLLYRLFRELLLHRSDGGGSVPLAAALLYAVHPVSGVPVNYLCARDLLLMQLFLSASLLTYAVMRRRGGSPLRWVLCLSFMALSLLSKTNAVVMPLLVLALELCFGTRRLFALGTWARVLPFAAVAGAFFAGTHYLLDFSDVRQLGMNKLAWPFDYVDYGRTQLKVHLAVYLRNAIWPFYLRPLPEVAEVTSWWDPEMLAGALAVLASLFYAWRRRAAVPAIAFCILAYWLLLAPTSSVLPFRYKAMDYRAYPSLAFLLLGACLVARDIIGAPRRRALFLMALAFFAGSSVWHNTIWKDEATFWGQSVKHGGRAMAHINYGLYVQGSDIELARRHFTTGLEKEPTNVVGMLNLGLLEIRTGQTEEGLARIERGVAGAPSWGDAHYWHGRALLMLGRVDEAADAAWRAAGIDTGNPDFREFAIARLHEASRTAQDLGDHDRCLVILERLHRLVPAYENSRFREAWSLQKLGRLDEAIASYRLHLEEFPNDLQPNFNLAFALMELERYEEALTGFDRTLEISPEYSECHLRAATCLSALGREEEAAARRALFDAGI